MPICAAERKISGLLDNLKAEPAFLSPFSAMASSLTLRAETRAISDITKSPFSMINPNRIRITIKSIVCQDQKSCFFCIHFSGDEPCQYTNDCATQHIQGKVDANIDLRPG